MAVRCFAYGSNLDAEQMRRRCPGAREVGEALLSGWSLWFGGPSRLRGGGVLSVRPGSGEVRGVVYELPDEDLERLDRFEGHPHFYERVPVDGAWVYVLRADAHPLRPRAAYLDQVTAAWRGRGFDLAPLQRAAGEGAHAAVFVYGSLKRGLANVRYLDGSTFVRRALTSPDYRLEDLGPFPGMVHGDRSVCGEVHLVDAEVLARLDALERHPQWYRREVIRLHDGVPVESYLYLGGSMAHPQVDAVAKLADERFDRTVSLLSEYLTFPAISCDPEHFDDVRALTARIRDDLEKIGLDNARVCELDGALPLVAAEWLHAGPDKPTVLIYGHLDLQPVKGEPWVTDPHVAVEKEGRLYARGAADDMGGWVSHLAALGAWLDSAGELPCNLKLVIEGEEEIGSPNLERFMDAYPDVFSSDVMVLTDCENPSTEIPGLTVSLRGLTEIELVCEALDADGHSGLWGNMVPDVNLALCTLIARLVDDDGRPRIGLVEVPEDWAKASWDVPLNDAVIHEGAHIIEGVRPLPHRGRSPAEWMWRQPAITVVATTMPTAEVKKNALRMRASATLSVRLAPGQTADEMVSEITRVVTTNPPGGVKVSILREGWDGEGWLYTPKGPAFEAANRAYLKAWGHELVQVGVGGSIPFVALFGRRFGDLPLILNGVMDPRTTAHGPNESMDLSVFRKAIAANVRLYAELGALGTQLVR